MGGIFGTANSIRSTETPRERRFIIRLSIITWIYVISAMAVLFAITQLSQRLHWSMKTILVAQSSFWAVYCAALVTMVLKWNRRHRALRLEEGLPEIPPSVMRISPMG